MDTSPAIELFCWSPECWFVLDQHIDQQICWMQGDFLGLRWTQKKPVTVYFYGLIGLYWTSSDV